jgi:class 3 adenylate cyclase
VGFEARGNYANLEVTHNLDHRRRWPHTHGQACLNVLEQLIREHHQRVVGDWLYHAQADVIFCDRWDDPASSSISIKSRVKRGSLSASAGIIWSIPPAICNGHWPPATTRLTLGGLAGLLKLRRGESDALPVVRLLRHAPGSGSPTARGPQTATIVFSDLQGSTSLGEKLDSESLREVLSRYFVVMRSVLEEHGGLIEKYIGDAIMAVFGLPRVHEDDALRAVSAAAGMKQALETLIGESTYRLVRHAVDLEAVEPLELKGKTERVPAFRVLGLRQRDATMRRVDVPMVGRDAELGCLLGAFAATQEAGAPRRVVLLGDPGVGKTRLTQAFADRVGDGGRILRGRCLSYGRGITFWPLVEIVRSAAGMLDSDPPDGADGQEREMQIRRAIRKAQSPATHAPQLIARFFKSGLATTTRTPPVRALTAAGHRNCAACAAIIWSVLKQERALWCRRTKQYASANRSGRPAPPLSDPR